METRQNIEPLALTEENIGYIKGLLEADGSFLMFFGSGKSPTTLKPEIRLSQKSGPLIDLIKITFNKWGIECKIEKSKNSDRADNLSIDTIPDIKKLVGLLKQYPFSFMAQKGRDLMIMEIILENQENLSLPVRVGLKKSLHKNNRQDPDQDVSGALSTETLENRFNLELGSSVSESEVFLEKIDEQYSIHQAELNALLKNKKAIIPTPYLAGLIDGDGSYSFSFSFRERETDRGKDNFLEIQPNFTLTMESNAKIILDFTAQTINSKIKPHASQNAGAAATSFELFIRAQAELQKLVSLLSSFTSKHPYRIMQYNLLCDFFVLKPSFAKNTAKSNASIKAFVERAYAIREFTKGPKSRHSKEEVFKFVDKHYKN